MTKKVKENVIETLPNQLKPFFWDVKLSDVDLVRHKILSLSDYWRKEIAALFIGLSGTYQKKISSAWFASREE